MLLAGRAGLIALPGFEQTDVISVNIGPAVEQIFTQTGAEAPDEAAAQRVEQYLGCDLMILDDLGTEMITAYSTSALYTLINTRLTRKKATIISTNCSNEELQKKYTPQILSRIEGEYQTLPFVGRDIRQIKKEREA